MNDNKTDGSNRSLAAQVIRGGVFGFFVGICVFVILYYLTRDAVESLSIFFTQIMMVNSVSVGIIVGMLVTYFRDKI